jgi:hypothetical protein
MFKHMLHSAPTIVARIASLAIVLPILAMIVVWAGNARRMSDG